MIRWLLLLLVVCSLPGRAAEAPHLSPQFGYRELAGIRFARMEFNGPHQKITYEAPSGWRCSSPRRTVLRLYPANVLQAEAEIESLTQNGPLSFAPEDVEELWKEVVKSIPPESEDIRLAAVSDTPLRIAGKETYELQATYVRAGQQCRVSVLFVGLGNAQFRFKFFARCSDFAPLHQRFLRSLFTWQPHLYPAAETPMTAASSRDGATSEQRFRTRVSLR